MRLLKLLMVPAIVVILCCNMATALEIELSSGDVLSLEEALSVAYENNREIIEARQQAGISRQDVKEAKSNKGFSMGFQGSYRQVEDEMSFPATVPNPTYNELADTGQGIIVNPSASPADCADGDCVVTFPPTVINSAIGEKVNKDVNLVISRPLYTFGKIEGAISISKLKQESDRIGIDLAVNNVYYQVREAYYSCMLTDDVVEVARKGLEQAQAHLDAAKSRFKHGVAPKLDVIRAEVEVAQAEEQLTTAKKGRDLSYRNLNNILGLPLGTKLSLVAPEATEPTSLQSLDYYKELALSNRIEVRQLDLALEQVRRGAKISRMRPTVAFSANYSVLSEGSTFAVENAWTGMIMVDLPVFDSGNAKAKVRKAYATAELLETNKTRLIEGIQLQVEEAWLSVEEAWKRVKTSEAILEQANEAVRMAEAGYKEGVTTNIELIDAQQGLDGVRLNHARALFDYQVSLAKLANAVGVLEVKNLFQVNKEASK